MKKVAYQKGLEKTSTKPIFEKENYVIWEIPGNRILVEVIKDVRNQFRGIVEIEIEKPRRKLEWVLIDYVITSLMRATPLIPFVLKNRSIMKLAEYLFRYRSKSFRSLRNYVSTVKAFSEWIGKNPDQLIA